MADIQKIYNMIGKEKFEPTEVTEKERIDAIEEAVIELAELLVGDNNG